MKTRNCCAWPVGKAGANAGDELALSEKFAAEVGRTGIEGGNFDIFLPVRQKEFRRHPPTRPRKRRVTSAKGTQAPTTIPEVIRRFPDLRIWRFCEF